MKTPLESWEEYRDFVFNAELHYHDERELKRSFFAGAESVFKLLESLDGMPIHKTIEPLQAYRDANTAEALSTIPPEDKLIDEIDRKSALGEIE